MRLHESLSEDEVIVDSLVEPTCISHCQEDCDAVCNGDCDHVTDCSETKQCCGEQLDPPET